MKTNSDLRYFLYEHSVQSAEWQIREMPRFHKKFTGRTPFSMREDFCGTGKISNEWVKKSSKHRALGIDLDPEPIAYGKKNHTGLLNPISQKRLSYFCQDVRIPTREKFDMIGAHNFSFFIFHERSELLAYAKAALKSLNKNGTFFLEMAGGSGFIEESFHSEKIKIPGYGKIKYVWETHQYDAVMKTCDYAIHFQLPTKKWINDAFTYHWRLWEIREVREILLEAGFSKTVVIGPKDESMTHYHEITNEHGSDVWLAYVVGIV